jgi:hypothetical protein
MLKAVGLIRIQPASAQTPPRANIVYYVGSNDPNNMYQLGCNQGDRDAALGVGSLIILDFGGQNGSGTITVTGVGLSNLDIDNLTTSFARGYYVCTGADTTTVMTIVVGTNNSINVGSSWGTQWANQGVETQSAVNGDGYGSQVQVVTGSDIETFSKDGLETPTRAWMDAYTATYGRLDTYDYGSVDGCNYTCTYGWQPTDYYYLAWGAAPAYSIPQVYNVGQADGWYNVRASGGGFMGFSGTLSQAEACVQEGQPSECDGVNQGPDQAWETFVSVLNYQPQYSDDIGYSNLPIQ